MGSYFFASPYWGMARECHPVWKDLALKRIRVGQTIAELEAINPPVMKETWEKYTIISYQEGLRRVGKIRSNFSVGQEHSSTWGARLLV